MSTRQELSSCAAAATPSIKTWAGFLLMCLGMFMAILDIQVVATSLPAIQQALAISPDAMSWVQTAYLIAEVIAIPLTGLFTRVLTLRWLVASSVTLFTLASIGCAFSGGFAVLLAFRVVQGFAGGVLIPAVFYRGIPAVSATASRRRHHDRWRRRGAGADGRSGGRRLDHGDLVVAVAVPDQRHPRDDRDLGDAVPAAAPEHRFRRACETGLWLSLVLLAAALASLEIGLKQAPHHGWLSPACMVLLAGSAVGLGLFVHRSLGARASGGAACYTAAAFVCGRLRLELLPWRRPVRLGLPDAGVSRLRAPSRCLRDRHHHAGDRDRAAHRRPHRRDPGKPDRRARADRCRFRPVRAGARLECHSAAHGRFRRDVLAANRARRRHHVLPVAADAHRAGRAARN